MLRLIVIDKQLRMLRPHENYTSFSYYQLLCMVAKSVVNKLCGLHHGDFISVCDTHSSSSKGILEHFHLMHSLCAMRLMKVSEPIKILKEVYIYYGPWSNIQVLVFTDGGSSSYFTLSSISWPEEFPESVFGSVSILFISLNDSQLSSDLIELYNRFQLKSTILEANKCIISPKAYTVESYVDSLAERVIQLSSIHQITQNAVINCGRLQSTVTLISSPGVHSSTGFNGIIVDSLYVEIFGFLNLSDLNNAPVNGRFTVTSNSGTDPVEPAFLCLLLGALQSTKTAAMCNIYMITTHQTADSLNSSTIQEPDSHSTSTSEHRYHPHHNKNNNHHKQQQQQKRQPLQNAKNAKNRLLWTHGYLHHIDLKQSILVLSVFERDCTGLPWLGQFSHLAPVTDFAGSQLYDDKNQTSPFPVRTPDHLSYKTDCSRYVSWASPSAILMDINKVLRLSRRLPEKSALLYKELNRIRSTAIVYGCPELLVQIHSMIVFIHSNTHDGNSINNVGSTTTSSSSNDQANPLQACLIHITNLLLQHGTYDHDDDVKASSEKTSK
ncbi:unnamed protein product [Heterobilharzia americana]|nr:unnamed protein product [Heterobilharzia americana]